MAFIDPIEASFVSPSTNVRKTDFRDFLELVIEKINELAAIGVGGRWYSFENNTPPANSFGNNGDGVLLTNGDTYIKSNGVWALGANIEGPQGLQGPAGIVDPDELNLAVTQIVNTQKGQPNGIAPLGADGKIAAEFLNIIGALESWNASTNVPLLDNSDVEEGKAYIVIQPGTVDFGAGAIEFNLLDIVLGVGSEWTRIPNTTTVSSVAGLSGTITAGALKSALVLVATDIAETGARIWFTPDERTKLTGITAGAIAGSQVPGLTQNWRGLGSEQLIDALLGLQTQKASQGTVNNLLAGTGSYDSGTGNLTLNRVTGSPLVINIPGGGGSFGSETLATTAFLTDNTSGTGIVSKSLRSRFHDIYVDDFDFVKDDEAAAVANATKFANLTAYLLHADRISVPIRLIVGRGTIFFDRTGLTPQYLDFSRGNLRVVGEGSYISKWLNPLTYSAVDSSNNNAQVLARFGNGASNVSIEGLTIGYKDPILVSQVRSSKALIQLYRITNFYADDLIGLNSRDVTFECRGIQDSKLYNTYAIDGRNDGFQFTNNPVGIVAAAPKRVTLVDCGSTNPGDDGLHVSSFYKAGDPLYNDIAADIDVYRFRVLNGKDNSGISILGVHGLLLDSPRILGFVDRGIMVAKWLNGGRGNKNIRIVNPTILQRSGDAVTADLSTAGGILLGTGNVWSYTDPVNAMPLSDPEIDGLSISGGTIETHHVHGLNLVGRSNRVTTPANAEYDPLGTPTNLSIRRNNFYHKGASAARHGIFMTLGYRNTKIEENEIYDYTGSGLRLSSNYFGDEGLSVVRNKIARCGTDPNDVVLIGNVSSADNPNRLKEFSYNEITLPATVSRILNIPSTANAAGNGYVRRGNIVTNKGTTTVNNADIDAAPVSHTTSSGDTTPSVAGKLDVTIHSGTTTLDGLDDLEVEQEVWLTFAGSTTVNIVTSGANKFVRNTAGTVAVVAGDMALVYKRPNGTLRIFFESSNTAGGAGGVATTHTAGATVNMQNKTFIDIDLAAPTSITAFSNVPEGVECTARFLNGDATLTHSSSLVLAGLVNWTPATNDKLFFTRIGSDIIELDRFNGYEEFPAGTNDGDGLFFNATSGEWEVVAGAFNTTQLSLVIAEPVENTRYALPINYQMGHVLEVYAQPTGGTSVAVHFEIGDHRGDTSGTDIVGASIGTANAGTITTAAATASNVLAKTGTTDRYVIAHVTTVTGSVTELEVGCRGSRS